MSALESQVTVEGRRSRSRRVLDALPDARGRRVVLVSHSLLNQNTPRRHGPCPGARPGQRAQDSTVAGAGTGTPLTTDSWRAV